MLTAETLLVQEKTPPSELSFPHPVSLTKRKQFQPRPAWVSRNRPSPKKKMTEAAKARKDLAEMAQTRKRLIEIEILQAKVKFDKQVEVFNKELELIEIKKQKELELSDIKKQKELLKIELVKAKIKSYQKTSI